MREVDQQEIIDFTEALINHQSGVFPFPATSGSLFTVRKGPGMLNQRMEKLDSFRLLIGDEVEKLVMEGKYLDGQYLWKNHPDSDIVIAIGAFSVQNQAKGLGKYVITVPVPLTNDAFCTNRRSSKPSQASTTCAYPKEIIIDLDLLKSVDPSLNLLGVGELLSFYYSILDYSLSRNKDIPLQILYYLSKLSRELCDAIRGGEQERIVEILSAGLIMKCCVMTQNGDHQIGCCGDHLLGHHIAQHYQLPHGKAVFYGALIMASLFPEWGKYGLDETRLTEIGLETGLIDPVLLLEIKKLPGLLKQAIAYRPGRLTLLRKFLDDMDYDKV